MKGRILLSRTLGGDPTAFQAGQVSLNPLPHIRREPVGLVVVPYPFLHRRALAIRN